MTFDLLRLLLVVFGIGLVIFVHEAGHYLAARLIGVRVHVFSLGFGPKLLGFRWGGTLYQVAAIPMGGYVAVAGEDPEGGPPRDDELPSKTVAQRFLYYSGGVVMNLVFAIVLLPIVLLIGVPFVRPVLGEPIPGGPAWQARLEPGKEVLSVNGSRIYDFLHLPTGVALGPKEGTDLELRDPNTGEIQRITVVPQMRPQIGLFSIDVRPPDDPLGTIEVHPGGAAERAGLQSGDRLLGVAGMPPEFSLRRQLELAIARGVPLELDVAGAEGVERRVPLGAEVRAEGARRLGIAPPFRRVAALRSGAEVEASGLAVEDRLLAVAGRPVLRQGDFALHLLAALPDGEPRSIELEFERAGRTLSRRIDGWTRAEALALGADVAVGQSEDSQVVIVSPGEAAARAGLNDGDRVLSIDDLPVAAWGDIHELVRSQGARGGALRMEVIPMAGEALLDADGGPRAPPAPARVIEVEPAARLLPDFGFDQKAAPYVYRTESLGEAVVVGLTSAWRFLLDVWLSLKKLLLREVPTDSLGGIITIGVVSHSWAEAGAAKLFFFLCLLSINLAFINVLPIPVLDGGHLFFLGVEAIKGSPVSERVFGYSQVIGLVFIVTLMIFVTYNDLMRWVF